MFFGYKKCLSQSIPVPKYFKVFVPLVYRRLKQEVVRFENFVQTTAMGLGISEERLGALLVGRWKSGTPISRCPMEDGKLEGDSSNYFGFSGESLPQFSGEDGPLALSDPDGLICPLGAHIRKVFWSTPTGHFL